MAGKNKGPRGGRPPGRSGGAGSSPSPGKGYKGGGKGSTHKGGTSSGSSGKASSIVVLSMAGLFGVPALLFIAAVGYVVLGQ